MACAGGLPLFVYIIPLHLIFSESGLGSVSLVCNLFFSFSLNIIVFASKRESYLLYWSLSLVSPHRLLVSYHRLFYHQLRWRPLLEHGAFGRPWVMIACHPFLALLFFFFFVYCVVFVLCLCFCWFGYLAAMEVVHGYLQFSLVCFGSLNNKSDNAS